MESLASSRSISITPPSSGSCSSPLVIARAHADGQIEARVHPALVPANWLLADVSGAKNAVYVQSYALGPSLYYGAGAGMLPTAMSVVSDCIDIGRNIFARAAGAKRPAGPVLEPRPMLSLADVRSKYYLRFGVIDAPGVLGRLMTILGAHEVLDRAGRAGCRGAAGLGRRRHPRGARR